MGWRKVLCIIFSPYHFQNHLLEAEIYVPE
jgi:hypothetical protein